MGGRSGGGGGEEEKGTRIVMSKRTKDGSRKAQPSSTVGQSTETSPPYRTGQSVRCLRAVGFRFETGPIGTRKSKRLSKKNPGKSTTNARSSL